MWRWLKRRELEAMMEADGVPGAKAANEELMRDFQALSRAIREAYEEVEPPPFDEMYAGLERKLREVESGREGGLLERLRIAFERRPAMFLAPMGAALAGVVLALLLHFARPVGDNRCVVESYTVKSGVVLIEQDPADPNVPTVIWYIPGG